MRTATVSKLKASLSQYLRRVEYLSAFVRQAREGDLGVFGERQDRQVLETLAESWIEIQPTETVRGAAERLLAVG